MSTKELTGYPSIDKPWLKYYREETIKTPLPECTMYEYLYQNNKEHLNETALNYYDRKISFKELFESIEQTAKAFTALGVKKGDIVTMVVLSCPETVFAFYALTRIGALPNMVNVLSSAEDFKNYLNEAGSRVMITWDVFNAVSTEKLRETSVEKTIIIEPANYLPFWKKLLVSLKPKAKLQYNDSTISWNQFIEGGANVTLTSYSAHCNDACVMAHTGGTTGIPKGVLLSHRAVNAIAFQYKVSTTHRRQQKYLNLVVPFVLYGIGVNIHMPLCLGFEDILVPYFKPEEIPGFFRHYRPNVCLSVPMYWAPLVTDKKMKKENMSYLELAGAGGDGLTPELREQVNSFFKDHNCKTVLKNGYGMTEMGASSIIEFDDVIRAGSIGVPMLLNDVKIVEPDTCNELTYEQEGEICISSPSLMIGYYHNPAETERLVRLHPDGKRWVHTGDLGHMDKDGFVYITGRIKRIILTAYTKIPSKIFPDHIEKIISSHPAVSCCCVVSENHPQYDKVTRAHIVLRDEYKGEENTLLPEIKSLCEEKLPDYSVPFSWQFRDSLPITAVGKVDWKTLENEGSN